MKKIIYLFLISFFNSFSQIEFENYSLSGIGSISIPNTMELQSGKYKEIHDKLESKIAEKYKYEITGNAIVFQQKGLNELERKSFTNYARIMLDTDIGSPGDYQKANVKIAPTSNEIKDLNSDFKTQLITGFNGTQFKLIDWYGCSLEIINGKQCLKVSYKRQLGSNPEVHVDLYRFQNNDRIHTLTISYRENDRETVKPIFAKVVNTFKLTNIR
jgi:hypothetical protein